MADQLAEVEEEEVTTFIIFHQQQRKIANRQLKFLFVFFLNLFLEQGAQQKCGKEKTSQKKKRDGAVFTFDYFSSVRGFDSWIAVVVIC